MVRAMSWREVLPPFAITGIGSLPHDTVEAAVAFSLEADVPYCPELPRLSRWEFMIPSALRGMSGLHVDVEGRCTLDQDAQTGKPSKSLAIDAFLSALKTRPFKVVKAQMAGPATVLTFTRTVSGDRLLDTPGLSDRVIANLQANAVSKVRALRAAGARALFFLDEPALGSVKLPVEQLEFLCQTLRAEGALVGIHCCAQPHWPSLLEFGFDVLSFDAQLSLDALLSNVSQLETFGASGGILSVGLSTSMSCERVEQAFRDAKLQHILNTAMLSPTCGLGLKSVDEARQEMNGLREAQRRLSRC